MPRVGDVMEYRDPDPGAVPVHVEVRGVSATEVVLDLGGEPYGFSWSTFNRLFQPTSTGAVA